ncbi:hypothetical protein FF38_11039 [Lucilia cuprina]|uniref:Uncharacterized protein n=1 Tax=Lucilia cuprina TaxID=7375 RepID=A0A0L0BZJ3_LUCCU|nr:hypothetical protein FF38_11039 [Lucilia cuprina]
MLTPEQHEAILNDLMNPETSIETRTQHLMTLRDDYVEVHVNHSTQTQQIDAFKVEVADLQASNSKLFRKIGIDGGTEEQKKNENQQSFSESVTLDLLFKGGN